MQSIANSWQRAWQLHKFVPGLACWYEVWLLQLSQGLNSSPLPKGHQCLHGRKCTGGSWSGWVWGWWPWQNKLAWDSLQAAKSTPDLNLWYPHFSAFRRSSHAFDAYMIVSQLVTMWIDCQWLCLASFWACALLMIATYFRDWSHMCEGEKR